MIRDIDGLLKCQYCARRFFTKIVLQNHSTSEHKNDDVWRESGTQRSTPH